jgi:hypothetical protein
MVQIGGASMSSYYEQQEKTDDVLRLHNRSAPRAMDGESIDAYRRRLASKVQEIAPSMKNINVQDARGSAFDLIERQIYAEARREAERPSNIPAGEMREMRKFDDTGRPFIGMGIPRTGWISLAMALNVV